MPRLEGRVVGLPALTSSLKGHRIIRLGVSSLVFNGVCVESKGGPELPWLGV